MELNLNAIITHRIQQLNSRISELNTLMEKEKVFKTIVFQCDYWINETDKQNQESQFNLVFKNINALSGPVIYIFELANDSIKSEMVKRIMDFRSKDNKDDNGNDLRRATAKVHANINLNPSSFLYVGSVKSNFQSRIKQHIGLGHKHTYALQIKFWAKPGWNFLLHYLPVEGHLVITDLEAAIAQQLQPLLGKREV
jgi:hypothetical protein